VSQGRRRQLLTAGLIGAGAGVVVAVGQSLLVQGIDSLRVCSNMRHAELLSSSRLFFDCLFPSIPELYWPLVIL